jgi:SAM-dependent methyltransferase
MNHDPDLLEKLVIVRNECRMFGMRRALRHTLSFLLSQTRSDFDRRHGVATSGSVEPAAAGITDPISLENAINYEPTDEAVMRHILGYVATHFNPAELTFVDMGCGKGRALLMAARLPFIEAVGVEISASHCHWAVSNVARYRPAGEPWRTKIRICNSNATEFDFPNTDLLVYLFNPFRGPVLRAVLDRLAEFQRRTERKVHLLLCSPRSEDQLLEHRAYRREHEFRVIAVTHCWSLWRCNGTLGPGVNHGTPLSPVPGPTAA